jgi:hypothetical protein
LKICAPRGTINQGKALKRLLHKWGRNRPAMDCFPERQMIMMINDGVLPVACVQTSSEAHPASYPTGTGGPFPGAKGGRGLTLTTHPHLVPRSRISRSYTSSPPWHLHWGSGTALYNNADARLQDPFWC